MSYRLQKWNRYLQNRIWGNILVLMYHRITDFECDPYHTCVTPGNFEGHLDVLQNIGEVIPGRSIEKFTRRDFFQGYKFVLTFDDGYRDNFETALPILEKRGLPATFFIIEKGDQRFPAFYWDVLKSVFLETEVLPEEFPVNVNGEEITINLGEDDHFSKEEINETRDWNIGRSTFPTKRHYWLRYFIYALKPLTIQSREDCLKSLVTAVDHQELLEISQTVNLDILRSVVIKPEYEIGSHTISHLQLSKFSNEQQTYQVLESRKRLESQLKHTVQCFAVPHGGPGDFNADTIDCIRQAGYEQAYVYGTKALNYHYHPLEIPRINIGNWDRVIFEKNILGRLQEVDLGKLPHSME